MILNFKIVFVNESLFLGKLNNKLFENDLILKKHSFTNRKGNEAELFLDIIPEKFVNELVEQVGIHHIVIPIMCGLKEEGFLVEEKLVMEKY